MFCPLPSALLPSALIKTMPRKKKTKRFRAVTAVKSLAREVVGTPPPTRRAESSNRPKREKHKRTLGKLLAED